MLKSILCIALLIATSADEVLALGLKSRSGLHARGDEDNAIAGFTRHKGVCMIGDKAPKMRAVNDADERAVKHTE